jgi:vacuolar-type H+-ATPase subunit I/STV1
LRFNFFYAGLVVLIVAFFLSFSLATSLGDYLHIVIVFEAHLQESFEVFVRQTIIYGILPVSIGLLLLVIHYVRSGSRTKDSLESLIFFCLGVLIILWGILYIQGTNVSYAGAVQEAHRDLHFDFDDPLRLIYTLKGVVGALWAFTGAFLALAQVPTLNSYYKRARPSSD